MKVSQCIFYVRHIKRPPLIGNIVTAQISRSPAGHGCHPTSYCYGSLMFLHYFAAEYSPFYAIEKGAVLQEARCFNDPHIDSRRCQQVHWSSQAMEF